MFVRLYSDLDIQSGGEGNTLLELGKVKVLLVVGGIEPPIYLFVVDTVGRSTPPTSSQEVDA